jgi:hypothetical protein
LVLLATRRQLQGAAHGREHEGTNAALATAGFGKCADQPGLGPLPQRRPVRLEAADAGLGENSVAAAGAWGQSPIPARNGAPARSAQPSVAWATWSQGIGASAESGPRPAAAVSVGGVRPKPQRSGADLVIQASGVKPNRQRIHPVRPRGVTAIRSICATRRSGLKTMVLEVHAWPRRAPRG